MVSPSSSDHFFQPQNHSPNIGPDPRAVVQREDAVEIADEIAEIGEERPQVHFGADRGDHQRGEEHRGAEREAQPLARDRLAIGLVQRGELLAGKNR